MLELVHKQHLAVHLKIMLIFLSFKKDFAINLSNISINNNKDNPYWIELYQASDSVITAYKVDVKAYLGFFIDKDTKELKVICQTNNFLWSSNWTGRNLKVNFKLDAFYFIPFFNN